MLFIKIFSILTGFLRFLGVICLIIALLGFILVKINWHWFYNEQDLILPGGVAVTTPKPTTAPTPIRIDSDVTSIFNDKLTFTAADNIDFADTHYINKVVTKLITTWDGTDKELVKLSLKDFTTNELDAFEAAVNDNTASKTIPTDLQQYFLSQSSVLAMKNTMKSAHSEYLKYLTAKGVNKDYINELETNTIKLEDARFELMTADNPKSPESHVDYLTTAKGEVINADYSRLKIVIYVNDIYKVADQIVHSGILGKLSGTNRAADMEKYKEARDIALRFIMYKQMTFDLQKAVETANTPDKYKKDKDSYLKATKTLGSLSGQYTLEWGGAVYNANNNRTLIFNLQANYVAFDAINIVYATSSQQNDLFKDYFWNRYVQSKLLLIKNIQDYTRKFNNYPIENLKTKVLSDFISKIDAKNEYKPAVIQLNNDFGQLPKLVADISALNNTEQDQFWQFLK